MREIFPADAMTARILQKQKLTQTAPLRWSVYVFPLAHRGRFFLYHYLTKQCVETEAALFESVGRRGLFPAETVGEDAALRELAESWFLVPADKDEAALYESLTRLLRLQKARRRFSAFTIMTTTACNARCVYCFEQGIETKTLAGETLEQAIRFIEQARDERKKLHLNWFGGEPLAAPQVIDRVSAALTEKGIPFEASMITNASLMDEATVEKMRSVWRVRRVQVSLDGAEADYNRRKNYVRPYPSAYRTVLENLARLADAQIQVVLRCNVDEENIDGVQSLIDDLAALLPQQARRHYYFYFAELFAERESEGHAVLFEKALQAKLRSEEAGFPYIAQAPLHKARYSACRAENARGATLIAPDGLLYNCDYYSPGSHCGTVWDGLTREDFVKSFDLPEPVAEKCRGCAFLPSCTSFTRCPVRKADCRETERLQLLYDLRHELDKVLAGEAASEDGELLDC